MAAVVLVLMTIVGLVVIMQGEGEGEVPTEPQGQPGLTQPSQQVPSEGLPPSPTATATAPRVAAATAMAAKFVAFMSANQQKEAAALGCEDSKQLLPGALMLIVDEQTKLRVSGKAIVQEPGTTAYPMRIVLVPIAGKTRFGPESGFVRIQDISGQPLCVRIYELK
ncbi:hypothetical protein [Kribbella koreensis]|uniref:hypothetical protein n=1 Tax=Kribbella koreensis TaxID=57909 RepID=UPI0031CF9E54